MNRSGSFRDRCVFWTVGIQHLRLGGDLYLGEERNTIRDDTHEETSKVHAIIETKVSIVTMHGQRYILTQYRGSKDYIH